MNKDKRITVRFSEKQYDRLATKASELDMVVSEYIRYLIMLDTVQPNLEALQYD